MFSMAEEKSKKSTAKEQREDGEVNWNIKARKIILKRQKDASFTPSDKEIVIEWEGKDFGGDADIRVPDEKDLKEFLEKHSDKINHGDLLTVPGEDRAGNTVIVYHDEKEKKLKTMENPDEKAAGYLTIPFEVLKNVTNAMEKYADIYSEDGYNIINMHLPAKDDFIKEKLGDKVTTKTFLCYSKSSALFNSCVLMYIGFCVVDLICDLEVKVSKCQSQREYGSRSIFSKRYLH